MVFSSHVFLFYFLPFVLLLNYTLPFRFLTLMIMLTSYLFYGWANPNWIILMLTSTMVDYFCGLALVHYSGIQHDGADLPYLPKGQPRNKAQKTALAISMITNLAILGFFKYFDFGVQNLRVVSSLLGYGDLQIQMLHVALPIGISFYTFQSMSYAVDVYRGEARPLKNPIDFACFVALFPHQLAGPIIRYWSIAEQIRHRVFTWEKFARGAAFISLGMGKKILLANPMAHIADNAFAAGSLYWYDAWYGLFAYTFQIYFDFSAYSDMAVGLALLLGFLFTKNFNDPYRANSITDFWRRWHISLSTWLRDYLYIPLGGNRSSEFRTYCNLMTVMLLGGLWHGASWNFVIWGGIHGGMLALERLQGKQSFYVALPNWLRTAITFLIVCVSWIFFRAETLPYSLRYIGHLIPSASQPGNAEVLSAVIHTPYHLLMFFACAFVVWLMPQTWIFTQRLSHARVTVCLVTFAVSILFLWTQTTNPFLYYQF